MPVGTPGNLGSRRSLKRRASVLFAWVFAVLHPSRAADKPVSFTADIRPVFENSCWKCHGGAIQLSKLDLRTREAALKGGEKGAAIVPGKAEESRLYRLVAGLEKPAMPLDGKLTAGQISLIKDWIDQGAPWDAHSGCRQASAAGSRRAASLEDMPIPPEARNYWAFQKPVQAPVPVVSADFTNPIDRFLEKTRREKGLKPAPRADRITLLRRAYMDLIGLPPTPAETAEYLADNSPHAWEHLIDKLLASPHYGERWGRHWLDVARYADSNGFEHDFDRPNAWRYRDYVIRAFNQDKPYNTFLAEQIAGDELDRVTDDSLIATGFLRSYAKVGLSREGQSAVPVRIPRRHDRHHRARSAGPHGELRALPQSQVRSDLAEGLLPDAGLAVRVRGDGLSAGVEGAGRGATKRRRPKSTRRSRR